MNIRLLGLVTTVTLISTASGCCGLKNFMFGRGAKCGLCQRLSSPLAAPAPAYVPQAPCGVAPYAPAATYAPTAPTCSSPVVSAPNVGCNSADCGCNGYAYGGTVTHGSAYGGQCECNAHGGVISDSYVNDPYMSSGSVVPYDGQIISDEIVGGSGYPSTVHPGTSYPSSAAPIQGDQFYPRVESRKVDTDGNKILWEEPLPPGAVTQ